MSAIVFFKTQNLEQIKTFYIDKMGCRLWLDQGDCLILRHGNQLVGFCQRDTVEREGMLTFFYQSKSEIDNLYNKFKDVAVAAPVMNEKYNIYQFFALDPEGRNLEFQYFNHSLPGYCSADEILASRRSVRKFKTQQVPQEIINQILEICRFAPTSKNSQSYYFRFITDSQIRQQVSEARGKPSSSIANAPLALAICSDPALSLRHIQDGCIAAYHFMLTAWFHGLGTCWIAAMDRDDVKEMLNISADHYIATVTPVGYPISSVNPPARHESDWFVR